MRLYLILVAISLIFVILQVSFFSVFNLYSDIALSYILAVTYQNRSSVSVNVAFSTGILLDGLGNANFGVFTLFYTVFTVLSMYVFKFFGAKFIALPITAFTLFIIEVLFLSRFMLVKADIISGIFTALLSCLLYPLVLFIFGKFGQNDPTQLRMVL